MYILVGAYTYINADIYSLDTHAYIHTYILAYVLVLLYDFFVQNFYSK